MIYRLGVFPFTTEEEMDFIRAQLSAMLRTAHGQRPSRFPKSIKFELYRLSIERLPSIRIDAYTCFRTEQAAKRYARRFAIDESLCLKCVGRYAGAATLAELGEGESQRIPLGDILVNDLIKPFDNIRFDVSYDYLKGRRLKDVRKGGSNE